MRKDTFKEHSIRFAKWMENRDINNVDNEYELFMSFAYDDNEGQHSLFDNEIKVPVKRKKRKVKEYYGDNSNVLLTKDEYLKLKNKHLDNCDSLIQWFDDYIEDKGYKSKSHYHAIIRWVENAFYEKMNKKNVTNGRATIAEIATQMRINRSRQG